LGPGLHVIAVLAPGPAALCQAMNFLSRSVGHPHLNIRFQLSLLLSAIAQAGNAW
jgi:hypothetical protein